MTKTHRSWFCDNRSELWVTLHKCHYGQKEWYALVRQIGSCLLFWQMHSWCVRLCKCKGRNLSQASIVRPQWPLNCALCECDNDRPTCWLNCLNSTQHSLHFFIGPTSDHCLALSVINWLTSVLWASLILLKILTKYKLSLYTLDLVIFFVPSCCHYILSSRWFYPPLELTECGSIFAIFSPFCVHHDLHGQKMTFPDDFISKESLDGIQGPCVDFVAHVWP